ncbi:hypothetical protein K5549_005760 [Capra hircus]|nr:hypothetical protein K5549_005760 [Capra hircus]
MGIIAVANDTNSSKNSSCNIYSEFECGNGECIDYQLTCDGIPHCKDKSDEKLLYCDNTDCTYFYKLGVKTTGFIKCNSTSLCVLPAWICDGSNDCGDYSDELKCPGTITCAADMFSCQGSRACVPRHWLCDGERDCPDGSDELSTAGCAPNNTCDENAFMCHNKVCIPKQFVCDHDDDCGDGSDESLQCGYRQCNAEEFSCADGRCLLHTQWQCDGDFDCTDHSDEAPINPKCKSADEEPFLILADHHEIRKISTDGSNYTLLKQV